MTDLHCPATVVLLKRGAPPPQWLWGLKVAACFDAADSESVLAAVDGGADQYRGETFLVVAGESHLMEALDRCKVAASLPVLLEVDSGGWRVLPRH